MDDASAGGSYGSSPFGRLPHVSVQVYVRKIRVAAALEKLERHVEMAWAAGLPWIEVVHGKGEGILREAVRDCLRRHRLVTRVYPAPPAQGGGGVTIAELARHDEPSP